jgi:NADPH-dependent 2,4-dienoyl-CoA reductase/sulfur reductase-like enzyme/nitrite reductase/ring-hydroxylating ferredoxin subunit
MSDDQDHNLDLTQWIEVEAAPDGGTLAGVVGEDRVFVWRNGNRLKAYNADCPHLGGPLNKGVVAGATIRCPWHHACFDLATGEATAAPAFDALLEYAVTLDDDRFSVKPAHAKTPRRTGRREDSLGTMAIVGGGAAGFAAADAIRKLGWRGGVTIFSEEREQPYDRTLLTKDYLEGSFGDDRLPIARHCLADLGVDFEGDESVQQIEPGNKRLRLANGDERPYTKLLLATGATPRRLDVPGGDLPHVMVLRSLQDCRRILAEAISGTRVAVVGGSFIAMESAASLIGRVLSADVIAPEEHPLEKVFGRELSDLVLEAHARKGVRLHLDARIGRIGDKQVVLQGGERIEADILVVGIGVEPRLQLAEGAGLALDRGVLVNSRLQTSDPDIFAAGDIARWPDPHTGESIRVEHWVVAERQGQVAAANMLSYVVTAEKLEVRCSSSSSSSSTRSRFRQNSGTSISCSTVHGLGVSAPHMRFIHVSRLSEHPRLIIESRSGSISAAWRRRGWRRIDILSVYRARSATLPCPPGWRRLPLRAGRVNWCGASRRACAARCAGWPALAFRRCTLTQVISSWREKAFALASRLPTSYRSEVAFRRPKEESSE